MNWHCSFKVGTTLVCPGTDNSLIQNAGFSYLPLDKFLVETDSPYLSPHPYRGKTNEPARVALVAEKIAELKGLAYETVTSQARANAMMIYRLP